MTNHFKLHSCNITHAPASLQLEAFSGTYFINNGLSIHWHSSESWRRSPGRCLEAIPPSSEISLIFGTHQALLRYC